MTACKDKYICAVKNACSEVKLNHFPQIEASDLLYRVITLEDIYLPLSLQVSCYSENLNDSAAELIRLIDERIAALEADENRHGGSIAQKSDLPAAGLRLFIQANPGAGKTTFCRRLVLAILQDDLAFFKKYSDENALFFNQDALPVLISCRSISGLAEKELLSEDFEKLMYRLCAKSFGSRFSDISEDDFIELIGSSKPKNLCIVLDGWDEILDSEKEAAFLESFNRYLSKYPDTDAVITVRSGYAVPKLDKPGSEYMISPLSEEDVREFCKKWCEIILSPNQRLAANCTALAEQILCSVNPQIEEMAKNPLDLSLLLTISKSTGRLPEDKAELFEKIVDLYIFWSINKNSGVLEPKSIRIFLSYIASALTKRSRLYCGEGELFKLIEQASFDLDWAFPQDVSSFKPEGIARELSHTGIFSKTYGENAYSFSENGITAHRQMQEYLTAYAIVAQYSDDEYNNMSPLEIFEDKYTLSGWKETIIFTVLIGNGRLRKNIIDSLIFKTTEDPDNCYAYTNLLFEFVISGANIRFEDKHRIYDAVFSENITASQISDIYFLTENPGKTASDFIEYIGAGFSESINGGEIRYGFAEAVIEASLAVQKGIPPFEHAEALIKSGSDKKTFLGIYIMLVLAWCKYTNSVNALSLSLVNFKMSKAFANTLKSLMNNEQYEAEALWTAHEAILADFADFGDLFDAEAAAEACRQMSNPKKAERSRIILSVAPVFDPSFKCPAADAALRKNCLKRLDDATARMDYDEIIFSFSVCSAIGCFSAEEQRQKWNRIDEIYKDLKGFSYAGKAHYNRLKKAQTKRDFDTWTKCFGVPPRRLFQNQNPYFPYEEAGSGQEFWKLKERSDFSVVYSLNNKREMRIVFSPNGSPENAEWFFTDSLSVSVQTNNNLAYMLRRKEIEAIKLNSVPITAEEILEHGINEHEAFSVINYALCLSGIYANQSGDYLMGRYYLLPLKLYPGFRSMPWKNVAEWWFGLAVKSNEYEGLAVLAWLFALGVLDISGFDGSRLAALSEKLQSLCNCTNDFSLLNKAILEKIG